MTEPNDPFWVENRAKFLAEGSTSADPSACGTCRGNAEAGRPVEHEGCAQRATLLQAPDHPYYEILAGFSLEENAKLPARFHIPVFDDCGVPNSWLCAVCQEEGVVTGWPCETATEQGTKVFTPLHQAETAAKKQAARIAELEAETERLKAELASAREDTTFMERNTLPDLRREIEHHKAGKQRWRERAETAETRLSAVLDLCDREQRNAIRWENPIPAPEWVAIVQKIALGDSKPETGGAA